MQSGNHAQQSSVGEVSNATRLDSGQQPAAEHPVGPTSTERPEPGDDGTGRSGTGHSGADGGVVAVGPIEPVQIEFEFPAELASLAMVRRRVEQVARVTATLGADDLDKLRLVLTEVVANAVSAHAEQRTPEHLRICCSLSSDRIEVSILDQGGGFLVTTGSHPVIDTTLPDVSAPEVQEQEGGFGLGIIDTFADESEFRPVEGGTSVRFVIYPSGESGFGTE